MATVISIIITAIAVAVACIIGRESLASFFKGLKTSIRNRRSRKANKPFTTWTATTQKDVFQGVDVVELPLQGKALKSLSFKVKSKDKCWRAGFKLLEAGSAWWSATLVNPDSILVHVGRNREGPFIVCGYQNQHSRQSAPGQPLPPPALPETKLSINNPNHWVCIDMALDGRNLVVDVNKGEFRHTLSGIRDGMDTRAFLVAWADHEDKEEKIPRDYSVKFKDIKFETR